MFPTLGWAYSRKVQKLHNISCTLDEYIYEYIYMNLWKLMNKTSGSNQKEMTSSSSYQNLAVVIIVSGCGAAIAFALAVMICCQILAKVRKYFTY